MTHKWITNNENEPLMHPIMYDNKKYEKRVSVTKQDIEYAVNLPENTIKHLRKVLYIICVYSTFLYVSLTTFAYEMRVFYNFMSE